VPRGFAQTAASFFVSIENPGIANQVSHLS
jgi:hypothetical protein